MSRTRSARDVFDKWAMDYHADGMEDDHWPSVRQAFESIPPSSGVYLEVGVGNGYGLAHMATNQYRDGQCIGIDISPNMVENTRKRTSSLKNVHVTAADFLSFDPGPKKPDLIFSMEVFYYLPDIQKGLLHAMDLLTPGGTLMVLVNHFKERLDSHNWSAQLDTWMQMWSAAAYRSGFEAAGYVDIDQRYVGIPDDPEVRSYNPGTLMTWGRK